MFPILDILASYAPALVTRRLVADPTPITAPTLERFRAVALFADISGFTPLAERLSQGGPQGVEELSRVLNTYFGQLIDLITAHGGDIVKFAGDALLALWPVETPVETGPAPLISPEYITTLSAMQCALTAQKALQGFEAVEARLSLRMGIGIGEVSTEHLGGVYGRWHILIAGDLLTQVAVAERQAAPGQVIASPEAWALVHPACHGSPLPQGGARLISVRDLHPPVSLPKALIAAEAVSALQAYVPGAIRARLVAGQTGWLAELRRVTVIFAHLPALDHNTPIEQAQLLIRELQEAIYKYEGSVDKLSVDEKGVSLIAVFGWPPLAHEDDAARGVQAALAMQAKLRQLGWSGALGVTTGRAFCGSIGNAHRREYTMIGDVVNLAARLMQASTGDILCDAATYQAAHRSIDFESLPTITVKGRGEPVAIYRPQGEGRKHPAALNLGAPIVGRTAERMVLVERLQLLLGGQGGVVILEGEAGLGKSRLVEELLQQAQSINIESLVGAGDAIEQATPYFAWRSIFSALFGVGLLRDTHVRLKALKQLGLDQKWLQFLPLLEAVLPLTLDDNDITAQMTGQVRADNTRDFLLHLLQTSANRSPKLVVLEDIHWLDTASWALTWLVSQQIKSVLLVVTTRPLAEPAPTEFTQLLKSPGALRLKLETLSPEDTLSLVCQRLGITSVPEPMAALIRTKAEGNPFYSEELAYAMRDAGLIQIAEGECRIASGSSNLSAVNLPDTIQGVITSRIDRLSPPQQLTLKAASVIGRTFALRTLRHVYPVEDDKDHLADHLQALDKLDLTTLEAPEPALTYMFKHLTTREVAYNLMLFAQRRRLHQAVAEWYEVAHAEDVALFYELLAHHWRTAGNVDKALNYLEKVGEQALENYANEEAIQFFSQALDLAGQPEATPAVSSAESPSLRRARWELKLGEAYTNATRHSEGRAHLEAGLALLGQAPPATPARAVVSLLGQVVQQTLHRLWPKRFIGQLSHQRETLLAVARTYERLTEVYFFANETVLALYAAIRSLNLAEAVGPSPELARAYAPVGTILGFIPLHRLAQSYSRRALEMVRPMNNLSARAWVSLVAGVYYAGLGQWATAHGLFNEVVDISEKLGDRRRWDDGVTNLVMVNYFQGEFARALKLADDFYASASRRGDVNNQAWALKEKAYCALALGQLAQVAECVDRLQAIFTEQAKIVASDESLRIDVYGLFAITRLRQGQPEAAWEAAEPALEWIARSSPTSYPALLGYASLAEVCLTLWQNDAQASRKAAAQRACLGLRKFAGVFPIGQPRAWLWQGHFEWLAGQTTKAQQSWQKSLEAARKMMMPYEVGLAHAELGLHAPLNSPERQAHLEHAREILAHLGAGTDLVRVQGG